MKKPCQQLGLYAYNCKKYLSAGNYPKYLILARVITYWFNLTNMLQHHSITVELRRQLERANERSLATCFLTFQWKKMSKKMKKDVIRRNTKRPFLVTLEADDRVWYVTYQNKVKQTRWETTRKNRCRILYLVLVMTLPFTK